MAHNLTLVYVEDCDPTVSLYKDNSLATTFLYDESLPSDIAHWVNRYVKGQFKWDEVSIPYTDSPSGWVVSHFLEFNTMPEYIDFEKHYIIQERQRQFEEQNHGE